MGVKFFALVVTLMVTLVTITGLILIGSPLTERERRFDERRVNNLSEISSAVDQYFSKTDHLPTSLNEFLKPEVARLYYIGSITDPQTSTPYEYSITGKSSYRLCATFNLANNKTSSASNLQTSTRENNVWEHPAGKKCFDLISPPSNQRGRGQI